MQALARPVIKALKQKPSPFPDCAFLGAGIHREANPEDVTEVLTAARGVTGARSLFDAGCGRGIVMQVAAQMGFIAAGAEIDETLRSEWRRLNSSFTAELRPGSATLLAVRDFDQVDLGCYDLIFYHDRGSLKGQSLLQRYAHKSRPASGLILFNCSTDISWLQRTHFDVFSFDIHRIAHRCPEEFSLLVTPVCKSS